MKTRKQLNRERILRIYFHYWKIQNNPEYIEYWKGRTDPQRSFTEFRNTFAELRNKLGLAQHLINPFKKIDWKAFIDFKKVDPDIINVLIFSPFHQPIRVELYHREPGLVSAKWVLNTENSKFKLDVLKNIANKSEVSPLQIGNPILKLLINLTQNKKDILEKVSRCIDVWRKERKIDLAKSRDQIEKFPIYAEVWDLRKGFPKKTFKEIARYLKRPTRTVESQFKRAYEYLYNKPYESTEHRAVMRSLIRKTTCKDCPEKSQCEARKIPCSDVLIQLKGLEVSQAHKLDRVYFDKSGKEKSAYEKTLDREAYRKWQEQPN